MHDYIPRKIDINGQIGEVTVRQRDNLSRFLHIQLTDKDLEENNENAPFDITGCQPRLYVQTEQGVSVAYVDGTVADGEEGIMTFLLPSGVTQTVGTYDCEIWLTNATDGSAISMKPFKLTVEQSLRNDGAIMATNNFTALDNALSQAGGLSARVDSNTEAIEDLDDRLRWKGEMALECLGDSFVDYRSGLCWNCQGFAADEDYFYIYRVGKEEYAIHGHLQKLSRSDLSTVIEKDISLEHCNDMTVVTIDGTKYILAVAGNTVDNSSSSNEAWLLDANTLSVVRAITMPEPIYGAAAVKGTNTVYLMHGNIYTATVTLDGFSEWTALEGINCTFGQGMDFENGYLYGVNANSHSLEIIDLDAKKNYHMKFDYLMQGYLLAEAESIVVFGDDVYINGGTNSNNYTGISQTLICHGNLAAQVRQYSPKANMRNLDQPIALYAVAGSDDGDYNFQYRTGFASAPFNSVYTAWLAAKSLFLLGLGSQFNIHVNVPITKNIRLFGGGFNAVLTSDIQEDYPAADNSRLALHNVSGIVNISIPTLEVNGGQINCTGSVTNINTSDGAIVFTNSTRDFDAPSSNSFIIGRTCIFSRHGVYHVSSESSGSGSESGNSSGSENSSSGKDYTGGLYKIFRKVGVIGDSLAVGHIKNIDYDSSDPNDTERFRRNLEYSWPHCVGRDADAEWLVFGQSGQTTDDWLNSTDGYGKKQLEAVGNQCQAYIIGLGENDINNNVPAGTTDFSGYAAAYASNYHNIIGAIRGVNSEAKIFCLTNPSGRGAKRQAFNQAVRDVVSAQNDGGDNHVFLIDMYADYDTFFRGETSILAKDQAKMEDHYSPVGYRAIADIMEEAISNTISKYPQYFYNTARIPYATTGGSEDPITSQSN